LGDSSTTFDGTSWDSSTAARESPFATEIRPYGATGFTSAFGLAVSHARALCLTLDIDHAAFFDAPFPLLDHSFILWGAMVNAMNRVKRRISSIKNS
jgi:hypothetical protein